MILPKKCDVANKLLSKGSLLIHLDPRVNDVVVPPWMRHQAKLVLQVGLDMPIPILDLRVDENGIFGTLSFSRTPFACNVPWNAIFALVGDEGRGMVWPESMPDEILKEMDGDATVLKSNTVPAKKKKKRTESKVVVAAGKLPRTKSGKLLPIGWQIIDGGKGTGPFNGAA